MLLSASQRELIVHVILIAIVIFVTMYAVMLVRRRSAGHGGGGSAAALLPSANGGNDDQMASDEMHTTAKLLHAANATVYGSRQCGYTVRQMERFGMHADMIDYVDCGGERSACEGIRGFPTWKIGSQTLMGDQPLHALRAAAERVLNQPSPAPSRRRRDDDDDHDASSGPMPMGADDEFHPTL